MIQVITGTVGDDNLIDEYDGEKATWVTEPSGVLTIFKRPGYPWASYAPGSWKVVRDAD